MDKARRTLSLLGAIDTRIAEGKNFAYPRRDAIRGAPADWPDELYSLHLEAASDGFEDGSEPALDGTGIGKLHGRTFKPEFVIPANTIAGNKLRPNDRLYGSVRVWRATLHSLATKAKSPCWVVRRLDPAVPANIFRIVSPYRLKDKLHLGVYELVMVTMNEGGGKTPRKRRRVGGVSKLPRRVRREA